MKKITGYIKLWLQYELGDTVCACSEVLKRAYNWWTQSGLVVSSQTCLILVIPLADGPCCKCQMWDCNWHIIVKCACALLGDQGRSSKVLMPLKNDCNNSQKRWQEALDSWLHGQTVSPCNTHQFEGSIITHVKHSRGRYAAGTDSHQQWWLTPVDIGSWDLHWFSDVSVSERKPPPPLKPHARQPPHNRVKTYSVEWWAR